MIKCPSVASFITSTETPGARSNSLKPLSVTSITARLVTIFFTQPTPVNGKEHLLSNFEAPALLHLLLNP